MLEGWTLDRVISMAPCSHCGGTIETEVETFPDGTHTYWSHCLDCNWSQEGNDYEEIPEQFDY